MADLQSYTLLVNGMTCEVRLECTGGAASAPQQTVLSSASTAAPASRGEAPSRQAAFSAAGSGSASYAPAAASPYPALAAFSFQPTQATWVTARRVAHLPFH